MDYSIGFTRHFDGFGVFRWLRRFLRWTFGFSVISLIFSVNSFDSSVLESFYILILFAVFVLFRSFCALELLEVWWSCFPDVFSVWGCFFGLWMFSWFEDIFRFGVSFWFGFFSDLKRFLQLRACSSIWSVFFELERLLRFGVWSVFFDLERFLQLEASSIWALLDLGSPHAMTAKTAGKQFFCVFELFRILGLF